MEFGLALCSSVASGLAIGEEAACLALTASIGLLSAVTVLLVVLLRPFDTRLDFVQSLVSNVLAVAAAVIAFATESEAAATGILWAQSVAMFVCLALLVGSVGVEVATTGTTTHRLRLLLRALRRPYTVTAEEGLHSDSESTSSNSWITSSSDETFTLLQEREFF